MIRAHSDDPYGHPHKRARLGESTITTIQICRDFINGRCMRGSACKYLHSAHAPPVPAPPASHAYYYPPPPPPQSYVPYGREYAVSPVDVRVVSAASYPPAVPPPPYGYPYPYYLPFPPVVSTLPPPDNRLVACRDFLKNKCSKGDECKFAHVENSSELPAGAVFQTLTRCSDFTRGQCNRATCRFAHILNWDVLTEKHKEKELTGRIAAAVHSVPTSWNSSSRYCQDFKRGKCTRGDDCKFLHDPELCRDFNKGKCKFDEKDCKYVHLLYSEYEKQKGQPHPDAELFYQQQQSDSQDTFQSQDQTHSEAEVVDVNSIPEVQNFDDVHPQLTDW